jgi:hypothetical protein
MTAADHYWSPWSLPLRLLGFPLAFLCGCVTLLSLTHMAEYAGATEVRGDGSERRRPFPFREWLLTALRTTFPELR